MNQEKECKGTVTSVDQGICAEYYFTFTSLNKNQRFIPNVFISDKTYFNPVPGVFICDDLHSSSYS